MERSPAAPTFVGIDVAKDRLDVHLRPSDEAFALSRGGAGLEALGERLVALRPALVVLEATGGFAVAVAGALAAAGLALVLANPRQIRDFARATGRRAKTDRLDAAVIARFAEAVQPAPRPAWQVRFAAYSGRDNPNVRSEPDSCRAETGLCEADRKP